MGAFLSALTTRAPRDAASLEVLVRERLEQARAAWPGVALDDALVLRHWGSKLGADLEGTLRALHTGDLYLAAGCAARDEAALRRFEATFFTDRGLWPRSGDRDELEAVVRERLFVSRDGAAPRIASYSGQGPLRNWFKVATARAGLNLERGEPRTTDDAALEAMPFEGDGPELGNMKKLYRAQFSEAFRKALRELPVRERGVLRLRYVDGLTLDQTAAVYEVHPVTLSRWQAKALEAVFRHIRAALMTELHVDSSELDSILRLVRSGLEVSLGGMMRNSKESPAVAISSSGGR